MADPSSKPVKPAAGLGVFDVLLGSGTEKQATIKAAPVANSHPSHKAKPATGLGVLDVTMGSGDEVTANQNAAPVKNAKNIANDKERRA